MVDTKDQVLLNKENTLRWERRLAEEGKTGNAAHGEGGRFLQGKARREPRKMLRAKGSLVALEGVCTESSCWQLARNKR